MCNDNPQWILASIRINQQLWKPGLVCSFTLRVFIKEVVEEKTTPTMPILLAVFSTWRVPSKLMRLKSAWTGKTTDQSFWVLSPEEWGTLMSPNTQTFFWVSSNFRTYPLSVMLPLAES